MQLTLILRIAWHSERCCAILHAIPQFARYCAENRTRIMDKFTVKTKTEYYKMHVAFGKLHCTKLDAHGRTLPASIDHDGKKWCRNGELHREDRDAQGRVLPAHIVDGNKYWYFNGELHRTDCDENDDELPAIELACGIEVWAHHGEIIKSYDGVEETTT